MPNNKLAKPKTIEEIKQAISSSATGFDAWYILRQADKEIKDLKEPKEFTLD